MSQPTHNIRQFFAILNKSKKHFRIDITKEKLVLEYTERRTEHLNEMSKYEFNKMINEMNAKINNNSDKIIAETGGRAFGKTAEMGLDNDKRRRLMSTFHNLAAAAPAVYGSSVVNGKVSVDVMMQHINKYGCTLKSVGKKESLNDFDSTSISHLINQFDKILLGYYR